MLVKDPVPVPSDVKLSATVGSVEVLKHTPLAVIGAPPLLEILPPVDAVELVIELSDVVVSVASAYVENITSLP